MSAAEISLEFFAPAEPLRDYISTYHLLTIDAHGGEPVRDRLHPEWGNVRFFFEGEMRGATLGQTPEPQPDAILVGPTSHATPLEASNSKVWGVGLTPLGWAALIGRNASDYANRAEELSIVFGEEVRDEAVAGLRGAANNEDRVALIDRLMLARLGRFKFDRKRIVAVHGALTDPDVRTVAELEAVVGLSHRQFEHTAKTVFGFGPKMLLKSQRFARTLGQAMLAPESEWAGILDMAYYDHAHFIRDFKTFMGMTPTQYMATPHPVVAAGAVQRASFAGAPMQVLHKPAEDETGESFA